MAFDRQVSFPEGSMAMAYDRASVRAIKSFLAIGRLRVRRGTFDLPAYGSIETRPMIHASAPSVAAVRSYAADGLLGEGQFHGTSFPSIGGVMWQMTYGRLVFIAPLEALPTSGKSAAVDRRAPRASQSSASRAGSSALPWRRGSAGSGRPRRA